MPSGLYFLSPTFMWQQWVNGVLGLWVVAIPFVGMDAAQATWALAITGLAIAVLGFWGATEHQAMMQGDTRMMGNVH